ncbi:P-type conjugative transfer protein TrbJ [Acetobacter fabarum]|uniref:P-type conjugative transfer protein TrbJ n=1 Tax=Acetobacter fabarum TaxID=483199 RepID=UPI0038D206F9
MTAKSFRPSAEFFGRASEKHFRRSVLLTSAMLAVGGTFSPLHPAHAQWAVYDGANHVENVLIAARTLQQIDNQITSLANQAQMLVNQGRNLASLPLSTLSTLQSTISQTTALLAQAQNIAYSVQSVEQQYQQAYTSVSSGMSDSALFNQAQTRWQNSIGGFEDALKLQARVVGNIPSDSSAMSQLVSSSQTSTGAVQAAQAGNQLLALQSRQLSDIQAELAANGRATALQQAREAATEAESVAQYQHFSRHDAYVPGTVSMFGSSGN